ncbi:hypothetical protein BDR06DRAFT_966536 [Suillus hirtellus]|nr:hypothetical protein BDR06DRAFT_966536 [Suillus hirtellus]
MQPITSELLGEATGISTTPHTAGHPSVPLKRHPGEVLADHLQVQCDLVLDFILWKPHEKYSKVFSRITPYHYNTILHIVEKLAGKPRLFYDYKNFQLEVEMPSCVHDSVMNVIQHGLESVGKMLQDLIIRRLIYTKVHLSLTLNTGKKEFVSDCVHIVTTCSNPPIRKIPSLVEVVYSQAEAPLLGRF